MERQINVVAKTRQQIANEYGVDRKTLNNWLKQAKVEVPCGLIYPSAVELIYKTFGYPNSKQLERLQNL